jgi:hypothetical protein
MYTCEENHILKRDHTSEELVLSNIRVGGLIICAEDSGIPLL